MNRQTLIALIAVTLIGFILFKGAISFLCEPTQPNSVANVISSLASAPEPIQNSSKPDPFSWTPVLNRVASFFSKACPK